MKTTLKITLLAVLALGTAQSFAQGSNDKSDEDKPMKKHLKIIKIEDGVKTELDTIITGDDSSFFLHGNMGDFEWHGDMPPMPDSVMMNKMHRFRFEGGPEAKGPHHRMRVFRGPGEQEEIHDFEFADGDSARHMIFIRKGEGRPEMTFFGCPEAPVPPHAPMPFLPEHNWQENNSNVIRLDSPNIISYKIKPMKDGTEKIEIVRKQPKTKKVEMKAEMRMEEDSKK